MRIDIGFLADHPHFVPTIASWLFQEWSHRSPDGSWGGIEANLTARLNRDRLPLALVALSKGRPAGTVSLKVREIESRPQYEYWLGALYVPPEFRRRGVGSLLVKAAEETALRLGILRLYLYTRHATTEAFYAGLGWEWLEELVYDGRPAIVMIKRNEID